MNELNTFLLDMNNIGHILVWNLILTHSDLPFRVTELSC